MILGRSATPVPPHDTVTARVIDTLEELARYEDEWDRLAVACGKPTSRPAWLRAWWESACAPADRDERALRVVIAQEGERLTAVFPWFLVDRTCALPEIRLLGQEGFWSVQPLICHDVPSDTLAAVTRAVSETDPPTARLIFGLVATQAHWPQEMRRRWPGGPAWLRRGRGARLWLIEGPMSFDAWVASRTRPWRTEWRRLARRRAEAGLNIQCSDTPDAVENDFRALAQLHHARWNWQSEWLTHGLERTIVEATRALVSSGDIRVWKVVRGEKMVAGALFARAGDASECLLTAFDPAWASLGPGMGAIIAGIQHELETGVHLIDLGHGDFKHNQRLANAVRPVVSYELFPCNRRMPIARARWLIPHLRDRANIWRVQLRLGRRVRARLGS